MIIEIDGHKFDAIFEEPNSPNTCEAFRKVMPFEGQVVHVRWSGEGMWIPLGESTLWEGSKSIVFKNGTD